MPQPKFLHQIEGTEHQIFPGVTLRASAGQELMLEAYAHAVREKYRFYSYGDCMLIL